MEQKKKEPDNTPATTLALSKEQEKTLSDLLTSVKKVQTTNASIAKAIAALSAAGSLVRTAAVDNAIKEFEGIRATLKGPVPEWCYGHNCPKPVVVD